MVSAEHHECSHKDDDQADSQTQLVEDEQTDRSQKAGVREEAATGDLYLVLQHIR